LGYTAIPALLPSNNAWTGTNTFTSDVSLNSNVYAGALASTPSDTNCVSFNTSTKKLGYTAIPALLPSNNAWTGTNTFNSNVSLNNTTTQINSTSVVGLSGGVINISGGTVNIGGNTTTSIIPHNLQTVIKSGISSGYFGMFISLSADGNILAVGSPFENNSTGAVRIYIKSGSSWIQQGNTIVSNASSGYFGGAVSLSSDGNALVVGSEKENSIYGTIRVYVRNTLTQQWGLLQVINQTSAVNYGKFVSLSSDGKILAVAENSFINIYDRDSISSGFGYKTGFGGDRVVVSPDGNTIAIGTPSENISAGAVRVYIKNTSTTPFTWSLQTATPITTGIAGSNFGCSLAFSYDGTTLAVGSQTENNYGAVRVYVRSGSNWNLQTTPLSSGFIESIFGYSISISYDGNLLAVGSSDEASFYGAVRLYSRNTSTLQWSQQGNTLLSGFGGRFGRSVSLSSDGNTLAAGADTVSNNSGSVLIFVKQVIVGGLTNIVGPIANTLTPYTQTSYSENSKLVLYDNTSRQQSYYSSLTHNINPSVILHSRLTGTSGTKYGSGVVISGDGKTMAISAPSQGSDAGAVYIYVKTSSSTWTQKTIITSSVTSVNFGNYTAISYDGNTLAIGSYGNNGFVGSVSVYVRTGTTWTTSPPQFVQSGYSTFSWFGFAVALSSDGNTMAVGSPFENNYYGAVRVYGRSGTSWTHSKDTSGNDVVFTVNNDANLGRNISLSSDGNTLAVGSFNENSVAGSVRIYVRNSSTLVWNKTPQFYQLGYSADSAFGVVSLSSDGNTLAVGSVREPSNTYTGAVRVYVRQPGGTSWTQQGYFTTSIPGSYFGTTVVVSYDGNTIVVGSYMENSNNGAVRIYTRDTTLLSWSQLGYIITSDYSGGTFGEFNSISMSADGNTIAVGSPLECAVRVYSRNLQLSLNVGDVNSSGRLCVTNRSGGDYSRFQTDVNNVGQRSGIEFGIPSFTSDQCSKIVSTTYDFDANDLQFYTNTTNGKVATSKMTITKDGYVGIGTSPQSNNKLEVAGAIASSNLSGTGVNTIMTSFNGAFGSIECFKTDNTVANKLPLCLQAYGGKVGIGTTSPSYALHVASYTDGSYPIFRAFSLNGAGASNEPANTFSTGDGISIYASQRIFAREFDAYSDSRIKTNIVDIDDEKALSILRKIQPKTYEYVDKLQRGNANVIGFIAQEIKEIIPKAVTISKDYIPNFMTICQVSITDVSNILLVSSTIDLSWNPLHDQSGNVFIDASGNASSDASGNKVFNVKLYDQSNNEIICKTTDVLDKRSFLVEYSSLTSGDYFLYGQKVDDFHNLNKDSIFTVVTAAVQDIDRIVQNQQVSITDISNIIQQQNVIQQSDSQKIQLLEGQVATLNAQLSDLQNKYSILENNVAILLSSMQQQQQPQT
jgi:hypothetical protein